jgi:quercetin dioxygenase-like cupin family protein
VRAGDEPPMHTHTREDEAVYVLDGAITVDVGGEKTDVEAGSYPALPKNLPHALTMRGRRSATPHHARAGRHGVLPRAAR